MKDKGDMIQFEYRSEVEDILVALEEWQAANEANYVVKQMIAILDNMDMNW